MHSGLEAVIEGLPYIIGGIGVTLTVVAGALAMGFALGLLLAVGQVYGRPGLRRVVGVYVWFFRGIPLLVLLFLIYFGLLAALEIDLSPFTIAILVLGLISSAYQSQILRGAILSVPEGQMKAARALGMSDTRAIVFIVLPQALRLALPGWSNEYTVIMKDSAVTYALGVAELMARTNHTASRTYQHLWLYLLVGLIYMLLTWAGTRALHILEERVAMSGYTR
ncbi:MAG TPA: amino acid ABC transporter permease [Desulfobacterales bacterium]|nr:amino acid ABC transporter permease [Desulfobacterales bacterium]